MSKIHRDNFVVAGLADRWDLYMDKREREKMVKLQDGSFWFLVLVFALLAAFAFPAQLPFEEMKCSYRLAVNTKNGCQSIESKFPHPPPKEVRELIWKIINGSASNCHDSWVECGKFRYFIPKFCDTCQ